MSRGRVLTLGCAAILLSGCLHAPVLWSPDGKWVAFTIAVRADGPGLAAGWLFDSNHSAGKGFAQNIRPRNGAVSSYRIWATQVETGQSVLLEESRGPLTSPAWSPDGRALAYGRLVSEADGRARFEVVLQDGPSRKRVLMSRPCNELSGKSAELPGLALAWSPDGRYLAVPITHQSLDLAIIRADNGRVLKIVDDAYMPSWSPDGNKLAFVRGSDAESLHCIDNGFGAPRHLADIGQTSQSPVWSRDGQSLLVVARNRGKGQSPQTDLMRVRADTGVAEKLVTMTDEVTDPDKTFLGASFSSDRDGENLFFTSDVEGQMSLICWFRPRNREVLKKFHPIDFSVRIGALAVSPSEKTLALRAGAPGYWAPPGLVDLTSEQPDFTPIVSDDSMRLEWIVTLVEAARGLLRGALPPASVQGERAERATLLPVPGELAMNHEIVVRLRRLGRLGRPLCDRPATSLPADPALSALLDEARLFFDYLRQDYQAALTALEALESRTTDPGHRLRLLSVRAQIYLAQGQSAQAKDTVEYLRSLHAGASHAIEATPAGPTLTLLSDPESVWWQYLAQRTEEYARKATRGNEGAEPELSPFGRHNFGGPRPGPGGGVMPIPFAPAAGGGPFDPPPALEAVPALEFKPEVDLVPDAAGDAPAPALRNRLGITS